MVFVPATQPASLASATYYIPVFNGQLLCQADGVWQPLSQTQFNQTRLPVNSQHFIGYVDRTACWVVEVGLADYAGSSYQWLGLRSQLGMISEDCFLLAGRALQILQWHLDHQFCGRCGCATIGDDEDRAKVCHPCDLRMYPRLSPCVIVLITRDNECLLARHARSKTNVYTTLAGFVEAGESLEDTLHREIMEEVGLRIHSPRYFRSQPWPFPGQLMVGFHVDYAEGDIHVDGREILDAQWWRYDKLPLVPPIATLAGQLIADFVKRQ